MGVTYEMAVGLKKGHRVTPITKKARPSNRKGVSLHQADGTCGHFNERFIFSVLVKE